MPVVAHKMYCANTGGILDSGFIICFFLDEKVTGTYAKALVPRQSQGETPVPIFFSHEPNAQLAEKMATRTVSPDQPHLTRCIVEPPEVFHFDVSAMLCGL
ncbi:MAG: hypothetical protein JST26_09600 [Bacteroidetes bacterium]|nr:hypothetical protein [Bacteroidota bacterium]